VAGEWEARRGRGRASERLVETIAKSKMGESGWELDLAVESIAKHEVSERAGRGKSDVFVETVTEKEVCQRLGESVHPFIEFFAQCEVEEIER
jgi:hypothetical protein